MVGRDTVTFRFRLDAKEMQRLIKALEADAARFGSTMQRVGGQSQQAGSQIRKTGTDAAASAVNFQTATTGMLNLSTAAVQTFTSISNLDRAANRLAMSKIALARAEDLLNNKQLRLNELEEKGLGNTRKAVLLTNELATARADLAVKTDKQKIEEGALVDIQLLFATNIANVMISSLTTIKALKDMYTLATIRQAVAESALIGKIKALIIAEKIQLMTGKGVITVTKGMTFAIKGMTFSVRGLMIALGPIAIALTAVTVAMQAYEENWGGLKDKLQSALPFLKETNTDLDDAARLLEEDRINLDNYNQSIGDLTGKLKQLSAPHKAYLEMMRDAAVQLTTNTQLASVYASQLSGIRSGQSGFSTPSGGGGQTTTGGGGYNNVGSGSRSTPNTTGARGATSTQEIIDTVNANPYGTATERQLFSFLKPSEKVKVLDNLMIGFQEGGNNVWAKQALIDSTIYRNISDNPIELDQAKAFADIATKDAGMFSGLLPDKTVAGVETHPGLKYGIDIAARMGIDSNTNRGRVLNESGRDLGPIADSLELSSARSLAHLRGRTAQFNQMGGAGRMAKGLQLARDIQEFTHTAKVSRPAWAIAEGKARMSFANGVGRIYANIVNSLISIGGTGRIGRSAASARRHLQKDRKFIANAGYIHTAKLYGFTQNEDFMARLEEGVVSTNGDIAQSRSNFNVAAELAQEFIEFQFSMLKSIGIDSRSASAIAKEIGMDSPLAIDAGFLQNAALVAQMNQSDFDNTNIIHESKTKLNMSNQEVFAIRFNGKRGDEELLDRIRFQDRLEAMSSGTSAF